METRYTNGLDPEPRSRPVFAFHKPETLAAWLEDSAVRPNKESPVPQGEEQGDGGVTPLKAAEARADYRARRPTFLRRMDLSSLAHVQIGVRLTDPIQRIDATFDITMKRRWGIRPLAGHNHASPG